MTSDRTHIGLQFIAVAILALVAGMFFGVLGGVQYILPDFLKELLPFQKTRPLHVSLVMTWIFMAAAGGIYYYLPQIFQRALFSEKLAKLHLWISAATGIIVLGCYFAGKFGGREYFEFPPLFSVPIFIGWFLFVINFFRSLTGTFKTYPVYLWMWATGIPFFLVTFIEAYVWLIPYFRNNIVRDLTAQWNAMGSMVGAWNMLVYGTAFYVMEKLSGNEKLARSKTVFFLFFLSMANMFFNWGHHTYIIPAKPWIKYTAYIISMTELLILGNIIWNWRKTVKAAQKNFNLLPYRLLIASDIWIFLNLILALIISIPAINLHTHGTHITVAHAMGATIGINTFILLASVYYIFLKEFPGMVDFHRKNINAGFWIANISLFIFWIGLIGSGLTKGMQEGYPFSTSQFYVTLEKLQPWFKVLLVSGGGVFIGIVMLCMPLISPILGKLMRKN